VRAHTHTRTHTHTHTHTHTSSVSFVLQAVNIDKVDTVFEEINETNDQMREINNAMANSIGDPIDEDDLEREYAELQVRVLWGCGFVLADI